MCRIVLFNYEAGVTRVVNGEYCVELLFDADYGMEFESHTFHAMVAVSPEPGLLPIQQFAHDTTLQRRRGLVRDARTVGA